MSFCGKDLTVEGGFNSQESARKALPGRLSHARDYQIGFQSNL